MADQPIIWLLAGRQIVCRTYARDHEIPAPQWRHISSDWGLNGVEGPLRNPDSPYRLVLLPGVERSVADSIYFRDMARALGFDV